MDFLTGLFDGLGGINLEAIAQLTMLALIVIAGPAVIFVLALRGGDL
ncbi:MAG TPA: photosystem II reaction center protein Ycf12 [Coleofasciculaceae cyanobacterium]